MREKIYGVYDMKNNEQCVGIFLGGEELAKFFGVTRGSIFSMMSRGEKPEHRYLIERIGTYERRK